MDVIMTGFVITRKNVLDAAEILERQPGLPVLDYEEDIRGMECFCVMGAIAHAKNVWPADLYEGFDNIYSDEDPTEFLSPSFRKAVAEVFPEPEKVKVLPSRKGRAVPATVPRGTESDRLFVRITYWNDAAGTPKKAAKMLRQVAEVMS